MTRLADPPFATPTARLVVDPLTDPRWARFVDDSAQASVFHHPAWLTLLHRQYRYPLRAPCVTDADGQILAGIPVAHVASRLTGRREIAVPFSDLCPILAGDDVGPEPVREVADALRAEHERHGRDVEVRGTVDGWPTGGAAFRHHVMALGPDVDAIRAGMRGNTRRDAARAGREGVEVRRGTDVTALRHFYRLHLHTRHRQGVPTQPWSFIRRFSDLFDAGMGFVVLAYCDGMPVAGAVYLHHGTTLTYKYGASLSSHLSRRPNHAIFMEAIRWGAEHGMISLDLGRTDLDNEGLRRFKLGWGAGERELAYSRLSVRPRAAAATPAGDGAGPSLSARVITAGPPILGRLAGTVLYRHFA